MVEYLLGALEPFIALLYVRNNVFDSNETKNVPM